MSPGPKRGMSPSGICEAAIRNYLIPLIWSLCLAPLGAEQPQYLGHDRNVLPGETVQMGFKTRLKSSLDLLRRDFHIITLRLPGSESVEIHLQRDNHVIHSSLGEEGSHAVYRGEFPSGTVALTATRNDKGFSGHIIRGDTHFYLEPKRRHKRSHNSSSAISTLPHNLYKMSQAVHHDNHTHAHVAHVPKDELEKAIQEMMAEEKLLRNSTTTTETPPTQDQIVLGTGSESESSASAPLLETLAAPKNQNRVKTKKGVGRGGGKKRGPTPKTSPTKKSASSEAKVVEIAVFSDTALSAVWDVKHPGEGKTKMRTFILNLINNMNLLYQQPSLGSAVSFRLVHLETLTSPTTPDPSGGDATKYLKTFCKYAGKKNEKGAAWDHALLLTGHNLVEAGDFSVAGMAWFSTMCLKYLSCSVSEASSFSTAFILTHELGHSLGMEHDGAGVSKGCAHNKFIMSPTTGKGKTTWSTCSAKNLKDFMAKGSPEVGKKDLAAIPSCLTRASSIAQQQIKFSSKSTPQLPGEIYSLEAQCREDCGAGCRHHLVKNEEEVCGMVWCLEGTGDAKKMVREAHPALEGSFCGAGKYCRSGKCVKNSGSG